MKGFAQHVHDRGRGYSNRFLTLCRVCTLYPHDAINWIRADHNKTFQKLHLNIDTPDVLNRQIAPHNRPIRHTSLDQKTANRS